jgi:ethanolamine utilization protein EutQ (cupin superfamily)
MGPRRIDFEALPWDAPAAGVKFKAYEHNGRRLRLAEFTREFIEPDWCTKGHIGFVLEGQMEIDFDGQSLMFGPGDGLFIRPGDKHAAKVITDMAKLILVEDV